MDILYDHAYEYLDNIIKKLNNSDEERYPLYSDASFLIKFLADNDLDIPDKYKHLFTESYHFLNRSDYIVPNMISNNYMALKDYNQVIANLGDALDSYLPTQSQLESLTLSRITVAEGIEIAQRFFEYFDKTIFKHFCNYKEEGLISVSQSGDSFKCGQTFPLSSQRKCLIFINRYDDSIEVASTLVHEIMHSYIESFRFDMNLIDSCRNFTNSLNEVITYFTELVFRQFLIDVGYRDDDIEFTRLDLCHNYINQLKKYKTLHPDYILGRSDLMTYILFEACAYGKTMAFHYFDKYLSDPERTKDEIIDLSLDAAKLPKSEVLDKYGFTKEKLADSKIIVKHITR